MAFNEGLKQQINLLAALQARNNMKNAIESAQGERLKNKLLQEQIEAAEWQNAVNKSNANPIVTYKGIGYDPRTGMGATKEFARELPGYISGVSPETMFTDRGATNRSMINAMASGGGRADYGSPERDRLLGARADIAEEQARIAQQQRQGYGSAERSALAGKLAEAKLQGSYDTQYDDLIKGVNADAKRDWGKISAGDEAINRTRTLGKQMRDEIDKTKREEEARGRQTAREKAELIKYSNELQKTKQWTNSEEPLPDEIKLELARLLPDFVRSAINKNQSPDINSFVEGYLKRNAHQE